MKKITQEELNKVLELHKKWLNGEDGGMKAYLAYADLSYVDLSNTDLYEADLYRADLTGANLRGASMIGANLAGTNMAGAKLVGTNFSRALLSEANLKDVHYDETTTFFALQCPEEGSFIAYKRVQTIIIKLEVPADAKRSSATTRKCRCSKAKVLGFYDFDKIELPIDKVVNHSWVETIYRKGEMVYPDSWDEDRWNECTHGIHFFITFDEAKKYF